MAKDPALILTAGTTRDVVAMTLAGQKHRLLFVHAQSEGRAGLARAIEQQLAHFKPLRSHIVALPQVMLPGSQGTVPGTTPDPRAKLPLATRLLRLLPLIALALRLTEHSPTHTLYTGLRLGGEGDDISQAAEHFQILQELLMHTLDHSGFMFEHPLLELEPWQVIDLGTAINAPLHLAYDCTEPGDVPCGVCLACRTRDAAFQRAGRADPAKIVKR